MRIVLALFISLFTLPLFSQENIALSADEITTSRVSGWEDLYAINNNIEPTSSLDKNGGAYGNWFGTDEQWQWVEYSWNELYNINRSEIYWWTDEGGIQIPYDSYLQYWDIMKNTWANVPSSAPHGNERDKYNITEFDALLTNKIRINMISKAATGILEWKVIGELGEPIPLNSTFQLDAALAKNNTSTITLTALDKSNSPVIDYKFVVDAIIKNDFSSTNEIYQVNNTDFSSSTSGYELPGTNAEGKISFPVSIPSIVDFMDGISLQILFNNGITALTDVIYYYEPGKIPPTLFPDASNNTLDDDIELTFSDNPSWRDAITAVYCNDQELTANNDYTILPGKLQLLPSGGNTALTSTGLKTIRVEALGYETVETTEEILPGNPDVSNSQVKTPVSLHTPTYTNIEITLLDRFNNPVSGVTLNYSIDIINNNSATGEIYKVNGIDISQDVSSLATPASDNDGKIKMSFVIPFKVDISDGIKIQFSLTDNTPLLDGIEYINDGKDKEIVLQNGIRTNPGFSWERTAQSDNFIVYWGEKIKGDPKDPANGILWFDPENILEIMESLLSYFNDSVKFITNPDERNMAKYKHEIVMNETWNSGYTGWAFGGLADNKIGGMWIHPQATNGAATLAHEFTHMNQAMVLLQYPGYGLNTPFAGFFWESHANYMMKEYTDTYMGVGPERFVVTSMMQFSTTRRHYQNLYFIDYIKDKYGLQTVNDIWRKASPTKSHPLTSLRDSVLRYTQDDLNDDIGHYAMKNVTWDYAQGDKIRAALNSRNDIDLQRMYTVPDSIMDEPGRFIVPEYLAPGDYGYNIIPVYPDDASGEITVNFKGLKNEPAGGSGWRYGFVAVNSERTPRYSTLYSSDEGAANFQYTADDSAIYFVISGAPKEHHNYPWEPGYPKIYRHPYTFEISGAIPYGHKPGYNSIPVSGTAHSNGGGWVATTASVSASAYVGPNAQVLGTAKVLNQARIEGFAIVNDNSTVKDRAIVRDNAIVGKGSIVSGDAIVEKSARVFTSSQIKDKAVVTGSALVYNSTLSGSAIARDLAIIRSGTASGTAIVGGDSEEFTGANAGTYLDVNRAANPDKKIFHPKNVEVNPEWGEYVYPKGEKPAIPMNLNASEIEQNSITLSWDPALDYRETDSYYLFVNKQFSQIVKGNTIKLTDLTPAKNYIFSVRAVDRSGNASGMSANLEITTLTSRTDKKDVEAYRVYPNPVNDVLYIEAPSQVQSEYSILNILGKEILHGKFSGNTSIRKSEIGLPGMYHIIISSTEGKQAFKIILSK